MKRIITLTLLLFIWQPLISQETQESIEHYESLKAGNHSKLQQIRKTGLRKKQIKKRSDLKKLSERNASEEKSLDSLIVQEWDDEFNVWENDIREHFIYDNNSLVAENVLSIRNSNTQSWQVFQKDEYTFNGSEQLVELLRYFQYVPGTWNLYEKIEFSYDSNGNETEEIQYYWDTTNSIWIPSYKNESTYDMNGNITLYSGFEWFPGVSQWLNSFKDEYFYTNGVLTSELSSNWNYGTSQWDNASQVFYTYVANQLITEIIQTWDLNSSLWINVNKMEYIYTTNDFLATEILSLWDTNTNEWELHYKDDYQYDTNDNLSQGLYSEWNGTSDVWEPYYKDEFVYDLNFTLADLIVPYFYGGDIPQEVLSINNMLIGYFGFEYINQVWVDNQKMLLYYSDYDNQLKINEFESLETFNLYPNPVNSILFIDSQMPIDKVTIYTITGQKVKVIYSDVKTIQLDKIPSGIYLLKIQSNDRTISKKLIKK